MCLINFHFQDHPIYKLIVAANRDEFYKRPTIPAQFWEDKPTILAGRDLLQGGTWLGITKSGRFAALTNFRDLSEQPKDFRSRGEIITDYLDSDVPAPVFLESLQRKRDEYAGFNLLVGTPAALFYYSNSLNEIKKIQPGTHGLSNAFLDTPWPKVENGKAGIQDQVRHQQAIQPDDLFDILSFAEPFPEDTLPDTGVGPELEKLLSSLFIQSPDYGTRSSTALLIDHQNNVTFVERTYNNGDIMDDRAFSFQIE